MCYLISLSLSLSLIGKLHTPGGNHDFTLHFTLFTLKEEEVRYELEFTGYFN